MRASLGDLPRDLQVFGRVPIAVSARCYHARLTGRNKDSFQYACEADPDGLALETLDGRGGENLPLCCR